MLKEIDGFISTLESLMIPEEYITMEMASLSDWDGITIFMRPEPGAKHNEIHVHAKYSGKEVSVRIGGEVENRGGFDEKKLQEVVEWVANHRWDIIMARKDLRDGKVVKKIPPHH